MTWWALTQHAPDATFNSLTLRSNTNNPAHCFASWAYHKPARHRLYKTVRGKLIPCGYRYIWDSPNVAEQTQPGDTLFHRINLTDLSLGATIWYYVWAPEGPAGLNCQGPLMHYTLPLAPYWPRKMYVATRGRGLYYTRTMTGPGGDHPRWVNIIHGLHSTVIWQLAPDLLAPAERLYAIAGDAASRVLYRLDLPDIRWWWPLAPALWTDWKPLISTADICARVGCADGEICWVTSDINHPGFYYLLFNSGLTQQGTWCLVSHDYGDTWDAWEIYTGVFNYRAGNIVAGIVQSAPPSPPFNILYAALCTGAGGHAQMYASEDLGVTWNHMSQTGSSIQVPRCTIDPTSLATIYMTAHVDLANPHELFRSQNKGTVFSEIDGTEHFGFRIDVPLGNMWIHPRDRADIRVLITNVLWRTADTWTTWRAPTYPPHPVGRLSIISHSPDYLYLGRATSAPEPPDPHPPHVLFVSQDAGETMWGKAGEHAGEPDGGGDSIPFNCGGISLDGILHPEPEAFTFFD